MSASQTSQPSSSQSTQVVASRKAQRNRLRTIFRASLCLVVLEALSTFAPMAPAIRIGLVAISLMASLTGIAAVLILIRLDSKH